MYSRVYVGGTAFVGNTVLLLFTIYSVKYNMKLTPGQIAMSAMGALIIDQKVEMDGSAHTVLGCYWGVVY